MQLSGLLKKDFLLWRRNLLGSICELAFPLFFTIILIYLNTLVETQDINAEDSMPFVIPTNEALVSQMNLPGPDNKNPFHLSLFKDCSVNNRKGGRVAIIPDNSFTKTLQPLFDQMKLETVYFETRQEVEDLVLADDYTEPFVNTTWKQFCFTVEFTKFESEQYEYTLRFNSTGPWPRKDHWDTIEKKPFIPFMNDDRESLNKNRSGGMFLLKNYIDSMIFKKEVNKHLTVGVTRFKVEPYKTSDIYTIMPLVINVLITFILIFPFVRIISQVVSAREALVLQNLENMGMKKHIYFWSTILFFYIKSTVLLLVISMLIKFIVLKDIGFFYIYFTFLLGSFCYINLGFLVSCFFVQGKKAIITGIVIFFALNLGSAILPSIQDNSSAVLLLCIISPNIGITIISDAMLRAQQNFTVLDLGKIDNLSYNVPIYVLFIILIVQVGAYILLALYCFYVVQLSIGQYEHPCFCFKKSGNKEVDTNKISPLKDKSELENVDFFQPISAEMQIQSDNKKTLQIKNLVKKFPNGKVAVDNLNLEMFPDQIFSLLGHNGAGKTTSISMISGLLTQSSGKILLYGKDSQRNKNFMKTKLGVCPQKNPIFDKLTVLEHLQLYSKIKFSDLKKDQKEREGTPISPTKYDKVKADEEIETLLKDIDLWNKRNNIASELSGGQKRKLCVALAFIGGSEIILLDEPTSGMDTFARRHLWEMLKLYKSGRIIILTTHNMDEADYLGDRIGIMSSGKQVTCGSSMFLKNKFGVGYVLNIIKEDEHSGPPIMNKIHEFIPSAKLTSDYGLEMKVQLDKGENEQFQKLFENFEERGSEVGVKEFGISLTTLEDVFLKVGNMFNEEAKDDMRKLMEQNEAREENNPIQELQKRASQRNNEYEPVSAQKDKPEFSEDLVSQVENGSLMDIRHKSNAKIWFSQFGALFKKRLLYLSRDKGGVICEIVLPLVLVIVGLALTKLELVQTSPKVEMTPAYLSSTKFRINDYSNSKDIADTIAKSGMTAQVLTVDDIAGFQDSILKNPDPEDVFDFYLSNTSDLTGELTKQTAIYSTFNSVPTVANNIYYNVFFNTTYPNAPLVASNVFNDALFKIATGNADAHIKTHLEPMSNTLGIKEIDNTADSINIAIMFSLAFAFIPTSIILFFINERTSGAKYQQLISGMFLSAYWIANFLFDFIKYLIIALIMYTFIFILDVNFLRQSDGEIVSLILFIENGPSLIMIAYLFSFAFQSGSKGQVVIFLFVYLGSFVFSVTSFVLRLISSTREAHDDIISWIFRLLPFYDFTVSFIHMGNVNLYKIFYKWEEIPGYLDAKVALYEIIFLLVMTLVMMLILIWIENWLKFLGLFNREIDFDKMDFQNAPAEVREDIEQRIKNKEFGIMETNINNGQFKDTENLELNKFEYNESYEEFKGTDLAKNGLVNNPELGQTGEIVKQGGVPMKSQDTTQSPNIKMTKKTVEIKNMYKVYKKQTGGTTMAVKGTFLDVFEGECFGLLGTNGAGKTTTFKIMCGELAPSFGSVKVLGEVMPYNLGKVRQYMGYCPQFDALLTKLTSQEHLELFCHLKGIRPDYHKYLVETSLKNLNLLKYRNVQAGTYSGGNKRKLNVAIALLGKPPIVFLDEPSSGMDPEARRFMWTVINNITNIRKQSSIVLTTHSMEEAEALTNRLAIMVEGRIKVLGKVQTIKNIYGDGFEIDIVFKNMTIDERNQIKQEIQEMLSEKDNDLKLSQVEKFLRTKPDLMNFFEEKGDDCVLVKLDKKYDGVTSDMLIIWVHAVTHLLKLKDFMRQNFPDFSILETLNLFVRVKLSSTYKLSEIFGKLHTNQQEMNIEEYNVKQMSLEQIFLAFADQSKST